MSEARTLRRRQTEIQAILDQRRSEGTTGNPSLLVQTVTISSYPATAGAYYGVQSLRPGGNQNEGAAVTTTARAGFFTALNLGSTVPPVSTIIIITYIDGRWCFKYDG